MSYFELRTPRDLLDKARREYGRLIENVDVDHVFNFFVTVYHIRDYVEQFDPSLNKAVKHFCQGDTAIVDCWHLCDKAKHFLLRRENSTPLNTEIWSGSINGAAINRLPVNGGDKWIVFVGDRAVDVIQLAEIVLEKWDVFLAKHNL